MKKTLIKNGRLINRNYDGLSAGCNILVEGNVIVDVSCKSFAEDEHTTVIDAAQKVVMPGLIDAHIHVASPSMNLMTDVYPESFMAIQASKYLEQILLRGYTSIRDAGGELQGIAQAAREGLFISPRIFYSGRALSQTGGHGDFRNASAPFMPCGGGHSGSIISRIADGITEVRKAVRDEFRKGATQIKIMASGGVSSPTDSIWDLQFSEEELAAIVEEAHAKHSYVMAHVFSPEGIMRCANAGIRSIEHGFLMDEATAKNLAQRDIFFVPTLSIAHIFEKRGKEFGVSDTNLEKLQAIKGSLIQSIKFAKDHHVKMGFGSDVFGPGIDNQTDEFLLRAAYQSPGEVLRSATEINAEMMLQKGKLGIIAPGAYADIIVVNGNPLLDLSCFNHSGSFVPFIMKDGIIYKDNLDS